MKKSVLVKPALLVALVMLSVNPEAFAQKGCHQKSGQGNPGHKGACIHAELPDLSEEQQVKIKELKTAHMKAMLEHKNELNEKNARLKTLQTAENVEMNKINKVIEEIGSIKTEMAKKKAAHHQEIRKLLTEEQRVHFDAKTMKGGMSCQRENCVHHKGCKKQM